jgi:hypothetical protein
MSLAAAPALKDRLHLSKPVLPTLLAARQCTALAEL